MDTVRVDIIYRPLRIGWVIQSNDFDAFRNAVKISHTLWGGRFNPILFADCEEEALRLADIFRVDILVPIGESEIVNSFPEKMPHLINPFFNSEIYIPEKGRQSRSQFLDIQNALVHFRNLNNEKEYQIVKWNENDPLSDIFMIQFGQYPDAAEIGIDYEEVLSQETKVAKIHIELLSSISTEILEKGTISSLSRIGIRRHYAPYLARDNPGLFVGNASNLEDLVCHWNLRAADISLLFIDLRYLDRYVEIIPAWEDKIRNSIVNRPKELQKLNVWTREEKHVSVLAPLLKEEMITNLISPHIWNGKNVVPPLMGFNQISSLGVLGIAGSQPKVSFSLDQKPFCSDNWFYTQNLVASITFIGGLYGNDDYTLMPPYIPELNEFIARAMFVQFNKLRVESGRIGLIIDATDADTSIYALSTADLFDRLFSNIKYKKRLSSGGLIAKQLISRLGGLQGGRVFKIPGVRRLLHTYGPTKSFTKNNALNIIAQPDPKEPESKFNDHAQLYIEPRQNREPLTAEDVFGFMAEKGLFRVGVDLTCPDCRLKSWISLDLLATKVNCELCGNEFETARQLTKTGWHYRRSGLLGWERNAQGAVPVILTLQQLHTAFSGGLYNDLYSLSVELTNEGKNNNECEVDFIWLIRRRFPERTIIMLGECKDQGLIKDTEFEKDVETLERVAKAFPRNRFRTYILYAKLSHFLPKEIERLKKLNSDGQEKVILLSARELEPYHIYDRQTASFRQKWPSGSPEDLAAATSKIYFSADQEED